MAGFHGLKDEFDGAIQDPIDTLSGLSLPTYDYVSVAYPNATTEIYTFKTGGSGGTTVATVTVVYTDSTKEDLSTVTKS